MEVLVRFPGAAVIELRPMPLLFQAFKPSRNNNRLVFSKKEDNDYQYLEAAAAMERASLRYQETLRPEPLFIDPYIRCLLPDEIEMDMNHGLHYHCLATKFIDDKLLGAMGENDELRQIVLLTDGMDTRPYRLKWPVSTLLFDVSPETVFGRSIRKFQDVGAKIPKSCLYLHVPSEASDIQYVLRSKGFNGARPSLWVFQGLPVMTLANFKDILSVISDLALKGCFFFGELPNSLVEAEIGVQSTTAEWMDKLFMSHGLRVEMIEYDEVSRNLGIELASNDRKNILFVAEQLQYSDDQVEMWRRQFQRIEEEGDEDGFEEL